MVPGEHYPPAGQLTSRPPILAVDLDPAPDPLRGDPMSPEVQRVAAVAALLRAGPVDRGFTASVDVAVDSSH